MYRIPNSSGRVLLVGLLQVGGRRHLFNDSGSAEGRMIRYCGPPVVLQCIFSWDGAGLITAATGAPLVVRGLAHR